MNDSDTTTGGLVGLFGGHDDEWPSDRSRRMHAVFQWEIRFSDIRLIGAASSSAAGRQGAGGWVWAREGRLRTSAAHLGFGRSPRQLTGRGCRSWMDQRNHSRTN
eukprot:GHVU01036306.1.p1 GENE.GHVU01036306.1~~GHVU01036306.1.p1  ORF type:complete len:105 (+),score=7.85 GHVU01036306.1:572-886(+)